MIKVRMSLRCERCKREFVKKRKKLALEFMGGER